VSPSSAPSPSTPNKWLPEYRGVATPHSRNSWLRRTCDISCSHDLTYCPPCMSVTDTPLRAVRSIHSYIKPLPALLAIQYMLLTLYLTSPLDCTTLTRRTRHDWHASAPVISATHHTAPHCTSSVVRVKWPKTVINQAVTNYGAAVLLP